MSGNNGQMKELVKEAPYNFICGLDIEETPYRLKYEDEFNTLGRSIDFYVMPSEGLNTKTLWMRIPRFGGGDEGKELPKSLKFNKPVKSITIGALVSSLEEREVSAYTSGHEEEIIEAIRQYFEEHYKARA